MDVNNATAASIGMIAASPQPYAPKNDRQPEKQQDSTVVKLSAQAQQMNRGENRNSENAETRTQESAEPLGIQFLEGEKKGGRVDTFA